MSSTKTTVVVVIAFLTTPQTMWGMIVEQGNLNTISDAQNPSDGVSYFDTSVFNGMTRPEALSFARTFDSRAEFATASQTVDFFSAAGLNPPFTNLPANSFSTGTNFISTSTDQAVNDALDLARTTLQGSSSDALLSVFTDPDGSTARASTLDRLTLELRTTGRVTFEGRQDAALSLPDTGHLIVVDAALAVIPEPAAVLSWGCLFAAIATFDGRRRGSCNRV